MLNLSRKKQEAIVIGNSSSGGEVKVTVLEIRGKQVKLGFEAGGGVSIQRWELWQRINRVELTDSLAID